MNKGNPMNWLLILLKWILLVLFFPMSLLFVAYFRERKAKKEYFKNAE